MKIRGPMPGELGLKDRLILVYFGLFLVLYSFIGDFQTQLFWGWLPTELKWRLGLFLLDIGYWYWIEPMKWTAIILLLVMLYNNISIDTHETRSQEIEK